MNTITLSSRSKKKLDILVSVAREMGVSAKPFREVTDEEMALPGPKVSKAQLEDWLAKDDGEGGISPEALRISIAKDLAKKNRSKKNGSHH